MAHQIPEQAFIDLSPGGDLAVNIPPFSPLEFYAHQPIQHHIARPRIESDHFLQSSGDDAYVSDPADVQQGPDFSLFPEKNKVGIGDQRSTGSSSGNIGRSKIADRDHAQFALQ